jgi:GNAT superfamily N-acetyltransferase
MTVPRDDPQAADVTIRPLLAGDCAAAAAAARTSLETLYPETLTPEQDAIRAAGATARLAHIQRTDPGGCWVAEAGGRLVGAALGIIREGIWGLSLLAILPEYQGLGIGNRLYAPALEYGAGEPGGLILSSTHPAALRRYARSPGFRLVPTLGLSGVCDRRRAPATLRSRPGDLDADAATIEAASRHVRGASHLRDLPTHLDRPGSALLVVDGDGFACVSNGTATLLAARTESGAEDLLWSAMLGGPEGEEVSVDFVSADNQWAFRVGLEGGLAIGEWSALFVRGDIGPLAPYLPSGAYL